MASLIGQTIGHYQILEQLGEGGMATVYRAHDLRLDRDVALKVIRVDKFNKSALERILTRFDREARALARLNHPNIVSVIEYGDHEGLPYLVMAYLPGGTLKQQMGRPLPWPEAARLLMPVARALEHAHREGIIHRDIKPANIMLTRSGEPMLTDFGIAKLLEMGEGHTLTGTGVGIGTPEYMAPEQCLGKTIDGRTDMYALAIVFYELITGRKPYTATTAMKVVMKQMNEPLPPASQYVPGLPLSVESFLNKALAKNPDDRYLDMRAFINALEGLLVNQTGPIKNTPHIPDPNATLDEIQVLPSQPRQVQTASAPAWQTSAEPTNFGTPPASGAAGLLRYWPLVAIGFFILAGLIVFGALLASGSVAVLLATRTPTQTLTPTMVLSPTQTLTPTITLTITPSPTITPRPSITPSFTPTPSVTPTSSLTPTATIGIGSTMIRGMDGMQMVFVPQGEFLMGSSGASDDERPVHKVSLMSYWIDQNEVTNGQYAKCVDTHSCLPPNNIRSATRPIYFGDPNYLDYPVIYVSWTQAQTYCAWVGARLPSEAEWEKAARGTDGRIYPWGNLINQSFANYANSDTSAVGSYQNGASIYHGLDMAGNVWEWVADWYGKTYYRVSAPENPAGPVSGDSRVMRGGAWDKLGNSARSSARGASNPLFTASDVGFRCAVSK